MLTNIKNFLTFIVLRQTIPCLIILFCLGIAIALTNMSSLSENLLVSQAISTSETQANFIIKTWEQYSETVSERLNKIDGISVRHDYFLADNSIPPPATFMLDLLTNLDGKELGAKINLYSEYPYPWRKNRPQDNFSQEALQYLSQNSQYQNFHKIMVDDQGSKWWKYAQAVTMKKGCVVCHNSDFNSPKRDWNVGDIRGVITISRPLDKLNQETKNGLEKASLMLGGFSIIGISALGIVVGRINENTKSLEDRVRQRTSILARTNEDLEKKNELIQQVFGRYLSAEIVSNLLESPKSLHLGGERRKVTILSSDLRGFTTISEKLSAEEVISVLNIYLEKMAEVISKYMGTISEIMGDGILVLFGAPTERESDTDRAIACALAMQLTMEKINQRLQKLGFPQLEMGIGINSGLVVLGNIGSEKRAKYGVVGNQVNLTFRIESYTVGGEILISESTLEAAKSPVNIDGEKQVKLKGIKDLVTLYSVNGIRGEYQLFLPSDDEEIISISPPCPVQYNLLEGKQFNGNLSNYSGLVIQKSNKSVVIQIDSLESNNIPALLTNLQLELVDENNGDDAYGKVVSVNPDAKTFTVRLTSGQLFG